MTEKRSNAITQGFERTPHRALLKGTGVPQNQMDKPFIGIASSFTDLIPGHTGMRDLERFIEKGVHTGGGHSFIFGIPGVCDGIAMGHRGMHYSLPTRELIADTERLHQRTSERGVGLGEHGRGKPGRHLDRLFGHAPTLGPAVATAARSARKRSMAG